jgi:hypothetical protein
MARWARFAMPRSDPTTMDPRLVGPISKLQTLELIPEPELTKGAPTGWNAGGRQSLSGPILKVKLEDLRVRALRSPMVAPRTNIEGGCRNRQKSALTPIRWPANLGTNVEFLDKKRKNAGVTFTFDSANVNTWTSPPRSNIRRLIFYRFPHGPERLHWLSWLDAFVAFSEKLEAQSEYLPCTDGYGKPIRRRRN